MTDRAPERIWANTVITSYGAPICGEWNFADTNNSEDTEYVRADIARPAPVGDVGALVSELRDPPVMSMHANKASLYSDMAVNMESAANVIESQAARMAEMEAALQVISDRHMPSEPMHTAGTEYDWACRQYVQLRQIARAALQKDKPG